jgi:protein-tyrosine phosphatase
MVDCLDLMNVLFVCTGNVCRSPMAEGFLRSEAERHGLDLRVRSTGTHAWPGRAATIDARKQMTAFNAPIDDHKTLELDDALVDWADLIIAMAREHERDTVRAHPQTGWKTFTLKGLLHVLDGLPSYDGAKSWVEAADAARVAAGPPDDTDVDDPFGERQAAYTRVATEIQGLVETLARGLAAKKVGAPA